MTEPNETRPPIHFWIISIVSILWNAVGALDFFMTQTQNESYLEAFTAEQLAYFESFPLWAVILWGIATWGSLLGSILLVMRKKEAVTVFLVSLVGLVGTSFYNFILTDGMELMGGIGPMILSIFIWVISIFLYVYSRSMANKGLLR